MIQLLFALVLAQMALILTLMFKTPLRQLVILVLDKLKQGKGPLVVKSVGATMGVVFASTLYSVTSIQKKMYDSAAVNPTDEVLLSQHLLEASLMGVSLFLALMIDRQHYYIRELRILRSALEAAKKLNKDE